MTKLKTLDLTSTSFIANGTEYIIEKELSIQRSVYAEAAKIELEKGVGVGKQTEDWKKVYELCNQSKIVDAGIIAYNNMRGFKNFYEDHSPVIKLCACYINSVDEDRRYITDDIVNKKAQDWSEEGLSMQGFFLLALAILKKDLESCANAMHDILETIKEFNEMMQAEKLNIPISV